MNPSDIYLIGLDLALNQDTGLSHSKDSNSKVNVYDLDEVKNRDFFSLREGVVKIKGNLLNEVSTTSLFFNSIKYLEYTTSNLDKNTKIYNLSKHGAYLENTIATKEESIPVDNFKELESIDEELRKFLFEHSSRKLSGASKNNINKEIDFLNNILEIDIEAINNQNFKCYEDFYEKAMSLLKLIKEDKNSFLHLILDNYFKIVFPYLSYHFNDIKIKNEVKKVSKIKNIFNLQIKNTIKDYIICLERL